MILDAKRIAVAAGLILLATGSWWLTRTVGTPEQSFDGKIRHDPDYIIENFNTTVMNTQGRPRYQLSAAKLTHYGDDGSAELNQPYLIQYSPGGDPIHTRAETGWMPKSANEILMKGNVHTAVGRDPSTAAGSSRTDSMKILLDI